MNSFLRSAVISGVVLLLGAYAFVTLRERIPALIETGKQLRQMQEENADFARENEIKRERIRKLQESRSEQDLEIRRKLKLLHSNETEFILPHAPKPDTQSTK